MNDYTTVIAFIGLLAYLEWRIIPLLAIRPEVSVESVTVQNEKLFTCHFCNRRFPFAEQVKVGDYAYCQEHSKRQRATPVVSKPNGRITPRGAPRARPMTKEDDPMPWEK